MEKEKSTLSRRQFVGVTATAAATTALFGLAGCSGNGGGSQASSGASQSGSGEVVKGGVLKVALNRTVSAKSLDPLYVDSTTADQICQNYGDTLVQENIDQSEYLPCIATKWEISEDGKTYTFTIRDDVYFQPGKFQDGRLLTSEDVAYSVNRAKDYWCNYLFFLDYAEATDDKTVVCHLKDANATFLHELTSSSVLMVPKEEVEGWGEEFGMHPVSTGPFKVDEHTPDQTTKLSKFDKYWGVEPNLDGIEYHIITEDAQAVNALTTGEIDISLNVTGQLIKQVSASDKLVLSQNTEPRLAYIGFNLSDPILSNGKVREALSTAIDRKTLVDGVYANGDGELSVLPVPKVSWGYSEEQESLVPAYDVEKAKSLLAEAGYPTGFDIVLTIGTQNAYVQAATLVQEQLKQIGVNVEIQSVSSTEVTDRYLNNKVQMWINGQGGSADPATFVGYFLNSDKIHTNYNAFCYSDPATDAIINEALTITDQQERKDLYEELNEIALKTPIAAFYATTKLSWGLRKEVHGYVQENKAVMRVCGLEGSGINIWKEK